MSTPKTFLSRQCFLQWRESLRMNCLGLRRISVFALALTMVLPLGFRAQANVTCAHAVVGADCCGANCPLPARHSATGPKCAFSRLPFSSSRATCETNSSRDPLPIARANGLSQSFSRPTARTKLSTRLSPIPVPYGSSLLSPALTSSHIAFGQAKVACLLPNGDGRGHWDAHASLGNTLSGVGLLEPAVAKSQTRQDQQVKCGRGEEAAQDDDRHRAFDLATRFLAPQCQRQHAERGDGG